MLTTITVDIGTTAVKLCVFDASGAVQHTERVNTPTTSDAWGEIYDLPVLRAVIERFIGELDRSLRDDLQRIAFAGVGESGGLVRANLSLATPMILWHDHRGTHHLDELSDADRSRLYDITGLPANANYGLSKVAWGLDHGDGVGGAQWLNIAEYLAATLTGERWSEHSLASRTMALDLRTGDWSEAACTMLGVNVSTFPPLRAAGDGVRIAPDAARRLGLAEDVQVHVAGHDHMVGAIGAGLASGELLNSTGTTEGLLLLRDAPATDAATARTKLANGIGPGRASFTLFASIPTGGSVFATLLRLLDRPAADLEKQIERQHDRWMRNEVDLDGLPLVLPEFRGSPPPTKNSAARGAIAGINSDTGADELLLGTFLGMASQFLDVLELFPDQPESIKVIGPASRNPLWLQVKADLLGTSLSVSGFSEMVSRGAHAIASGSPPPNGIEDARLVRPDADRHARLRRWRDDTRTTWESLKGLAP